MTMRLKNFGHPRHSVRVEHRTRPRNVTPVTSVKPDEETTQWRVQETQESYSWNFQHQIAWKICVLIVFVPRWIYGDRHEPFNNTMASLHGGRTETIPKINGKPVPWVSDFNVSYINQSIQDKRRVRLHICLRYLFQLQFQVEGITSIKLSCTKNS